MSKPFVAILFTLIISSVIITPTLLTLAQSNCDVSVFFDTGEEEDKTSKESLKDIEIKVFNWSQSSNYLIDIKTDVSFNIHQNYYKSVYRQIFSPPPELNHF